MRGVLILVSCPWSCQHAGLLISLSGLRMMSVHSVKVSKDNQRFIDRFGRDPRRLQLLLLSEAEKSC